MISDIETYPISGIPMSGHVPISGYPLSGMSLYRVGCLKSESGHVPISGVCNIVPDIGFNIEISSAKWAVNIYYQYAKSEQCTILHIDFGVCILFCILKDIYAE